MEYIYHTMVPDHVDTTQAVVNAMKLRHLTECMLFYFDLNVFVVLMV